MVTPYQDCMANMLFWEKEETKTTVGGCWHVMDNILTASFQEFVSCCGTRPGVYSINFLLMFRFLTFGQCVMYTRLLFMSGYTVGQMNDSLYKSDRAHEEKGCIFLQ